jgi:aminopeptidase N
MKKFLFVSFLLTLAHVQTIYAASSERSDTLDIRKTIIEIDITDFVTKNIFAHTTLDVKCKLNNISNVVFDLEGLTIDSIKTNSTLCTFSQSGFYTTVNLPTTFNQNDSALIEFYYHGIPVADATWGGFSFVGNYGFQMGVGFNAQPHSFGRTWHPCFDNFVERSSYEFKVTTTNDKMATCNGLFLDSTLNGNQTITWHYKLDEEIPSYLAAVAVSNYVVLTKTLNGINGITPATIACEAVDTTKANGSFAHLQESFSMLEQNFGPHSWPKVGYTLVPFNAGAMEHATNIHIGRPFIDGTLNYETLIAHELGHHWWGDLVTCSTAGDMWLNEGFASYIEFLHEEFTYGYTNYINAVRSNHYTMLSSAHINDDGYKSVANMDSLHTYGTTVYRKGADMIHNLRGYLGDSLFFSGLTAFINAHKFKAISSYDLRDFLSTYTGKNMTPFFDNWIFDKGWANFSIDSTDIKPIGNEYDVDVFMRQRKHKNNNYFSQIPMELGIYDSNMVKYIFHVLFDGRCMQFKVRLPFVPAMIAIDPDSKLSDATTDETKVIKTTGTQVFTQAKFRMQVKTVLNTNDSAMVRVEHHWTLPDRFKSPTLANEYILADSRYWKVDGIKMNNLLGTMQFTFDAGGNNSYLDSVWIKNVDDSIRLFYRKDATEDWQFADDSLRAGTPTDRFGNIYAKQIKSGEYCLGIKKSFYVDPNQTDAPTGGCGVVTKLEVLPISISDFTIYPNPTQGKFYLKGSMDQVGQIRILSLQGQVIHSQTTFGKKQEIEIDVKNIKSGLYLVQIYSKHGALIDSEKVTIY